MNAPAPLETAAFDIAMAVPFRGLTRRQGVLLRGPAGWGEFSPFPDHGPEIVRRWLHAAREAAFESWPGPTRSAIPVNVTVPDVSPARAHSIVSGSACTTAKVKVASGDDEARVAAVRDALGPRGMLRVDANAAWDVDDARRSIKRLSRYELEYVEQPVATLEEMARLRKVVDVRLAADESIRTASDPLSVKLAGAADIVVLKVHPLGGVKACLRLAEACGLPVVVSSALETSVGLAAGVALAAALPELPYACGLATQDMLGGDVVSDPLVARGGRIDVRRPAVDPGALREHLVEPPRQDADLARLIHLVTNPTMQ